jgi:hypothetical protein
MGLYRCVCLYVCLCVHVCACGCASICAVLSLILVGCAQVVEVKVGSTVPVIKNVRAMPVPTAAMWPQILCDFEFDGAALLSMYRMKGA